jgi:hypothetical protein
VTTRELYSRSPRGMSRKYISIAPVIGREAEWFDSTTAQLKTYMKEYMMRSAKESEIDMLLEHYPDDQRAGSPFDTGYNNAFSRFRCTSDSGQSILRWMTRSTVQADCGTSRRFRFPWTASTVIAGHGWKAEIMGI